MRNRVTRNDDGGPSTNPPSLSIFDLTGRAAGKATIRYLDDNDLSAAIQRILLNCEEIQPTLGNIILIFFPFIHIIKFDHDLNE